MPGLDTPIALLPPLQHETPPSVPNHIAQIQPWVIAHLQSSILRGVHYEHQLYGDITSFLASIFPTKRQFMVKPQGLLRKALDPDDVDLQNASFGSTGAYHESRHLRMYHNLSADYQNILIICLAGSEADLFIPDFITVKVLDFQTHQLVSIVEIKRNEEVSQSRAIEQVIGYFTRAMKHPSRDSELCAYLVMGKMVHRIRMERNGNRWYLVQDPAFDMLAPGDEFTTQLCEIAIRNWN